MNWLDLSLEILGEFINMHWPVLLLIAAVAAGLLLI